MKKILNFWKVAEYAALCLLLYAAVLLAVNRRYQLAVTAGIELWAAAILPALFPYLVITTLVSALGIIGDVAKVFSPFAKRTFNVSGNVFYAFTVSLISGYPVGAKTVSDLKNGGFIGETESVRAAALCSSASPVFLIGSVGNITFNSPFFGLCLFITHVISVVVTGFVFSFYKRGERPAVDSPVALKRSENLLYDGVSSAVVSVLVVGGIITLFYLLTEMLAGAGVLGIISDFINLFIGDKTVSTGIAAGFFECTKGIKIIAGKGINVFTLPITASLVGFGGLSVIAQSLAFLNKAKIKTAPFLLSKTLAAIISFSVGLIFSLIFFA